MQSRSGRSVPKRRLLPRIYVREWRDALGLTQEQLAGRIEKSTSTVSQLESGKQGYSPEMLAALAHAFDCDAADLFRDPDAPDYKLWRIIAALAPEDRVRALRVIEALNPQAA